MDTEKMFMYLSDLEQNNEREWFHAHKIQKEEAMFIFEQMVAELSTRIGKMEGKTIYQNPKELIYRLPRDVRFGADKTPYNPSFRAHISPYGKAMLPLAYFLCVMPGNRSFLGAGFHGSGIREAKNLIRDYIAEHGEEFEKIITAPKFTKNFTVLGEALKNVPRGYDPEHPQATYLKNKSWYLNIDITDEQVLDSNSFFDIVLEKYKIMKPFKDYLDKALDGFKMPERKR